MTLWRSFLLHLFWCCAIISALVLSDDVYPWASDWELSSYSLAGQIGPNPGTGTVMIDLQPGVDLAQRLEQMKKSCVEEAVRRRLNSDICAAWDKLHDAVLSKKGQ